METQEPLSMADATSLWARIFPKLRRRTIYQIRHAWLPCEEARSSLLQDDVLIQNIIEKVERDFFAAVAKGSVWRDTSEHWLGRAHLRNTWKMVIKEGRQYFPRWRSRQGEQHGFGNEIELPSPLASPEMLAHQRAILERIAHYVSRLSSTKRRVFEDLLDGVTAEEMATRDGISPGTARKRVHDLRAHLREAIEKKASPCP